MESKKFSLVIFFSAIFVFLFNIIFWESYTKYFLEVNQNKQIGDLSRMSYLKGLRFNKYNYINLKKKHTKFKGDYNQTDIITIGDSFSRGAGGGRNPFYQDFLASKYQLQVLNINPTSLGFIETILYLIDNGLLEKLKPNYILIQSVERSSIRRFAKDINWDFKAKNEDIENQLLVGSYLQNKPEYPLFNSSNFKALLYNFLYRFDDNAFFSKAYLLPLKGDFFNSKTKNKLLFYVDDLSNIKNSNKNSVEKLNSNLNRLSKMLKQKNIKLIFMPTVDKYNLYSDFILDGERYPKSRFFEELRIKNKDYIFVDTKKILRELLDKGVKNVFYPDDSHWSEKGSIEVISNIPF